MDECVRESGDDLRGNKEGGEGEVRGEKKSVIYQEKRFMKKRKVLVE